MRSDRFILLWLQAGLVWFFLGMGVISSNKLYQQGLVLLFWLPSLAALFVFKERFGALLKERWAVFLWAGLLLAWAVLSLMWSDVDNPAQRAKRLLYVILFCVGMGTLALEERGRLERLLLGLACAMGAIAVWHIFQFYVQEGMAWNARLYPGAKIDHPILGGYVMGVCAVIVMASVQQGPKRMLLPAFGAFSLLLAFMLLTQSRGVMLALLVAVLLLSFARPFRGSYIIAVLLLLGALFSFFAFEPLVTARGLSYRPEIFQESLRIIGASPLTGIGIAAEYSITLASEPGRTIPHTHNLFLHVAVELGVPGAFLFGVLWLCMGWDAWRYRLSWLGGVLWVVWLYATVAVMFDVATLWNPPRAAWMVTWFPIGLWVALMMNRPGLSRSSLSRNEA